MFDCERARGVVYLKRLFQGILISFQDKVDGVRGRGAKLDEPQDLHHTPLRIL